MDIKIPYAPRKVQKELHDQLDKHRWGVVVMHRRAGKTVMAINHLLREAVLCDKPNPRYAYIAPTYRQAKQVAWDYLKQFAVNIPMARFHETELRCDLPNGARIQLLGSENPASLRGIYLDFAVLDEMADMPENLFPEVIRPALSDRQGKALFIGTPRGHNAFFELYEAATAADDWYAATYKASETGILPKSELDSARIGMSEDQYNQEYECSWVANVPGSVFGKELQKAFQDGRISKVPYDPSVRVDTFFDLGVGDSTAIWWVQVVGRAVHFIDYYEARGEGLPHYARVLQEREYLYDSHYAPHDIEVRELGSGKSRREVAWDLGINFRVVPKLPIDDGIHAAQLLLARSWFDRDNCKHGLEALRQYHRVYNERTRSFSKTIKHDWSSHSADAFRYAAVGLRENKRQFQAPQQTAVNEYRVF